MTFRTLFIAAAVLVSVPAFADAGEDAGRDAGVDDTPDASAGEGGAQNMTQEGDETMPNGPCSLNRDCERGFACVSGRCTYLGYRQATTGCSAAGASGVVIAALTALALGRRNRRP
ncbi:MAG: hypothetical protein JNK82_19370 [Myxococcaceae bacterium]|nr:hypothetical protein [Myxococcaceae bacterium]